MVFRPYVYDANNNRVDVCIRKMTQQDAQLTNRAPKWQSSWTSAFVRRKQYDKYAVLVNNKVIALGMYEIMNNMMCVHIVYVESHPDSNPVIVGHNKEYSGIGRVLIAFGIKLSVNNGFGGDVILEAKTSKLAAHYERNYGAVRLPQWEAGAPKYLIADRAASEIFTTYLEKEE